MGKFLAFDTRHAERYGVNEAIIIHYFKYWIEHNHVSGRNQHDGRTWSYNSAEKLAEVFPMWSVHQVRRYTKSLVDQDVLITGNYNTRPGDRTLWYAFKDEAAFLSIDADAEAQEPEAAQEPEQDHVAKSRNGTRKSATPFRKSARALPVNNPINKPVDDVVADEAAGVSSEDAPHQVQLWLHYFPDVKMNGARVAILRQCTNIKVFEEQMQQWAANGYRGDSVGKFRDRYNRAAAEIGDQGYRQAKKDKPPSPIPAKPVKVNQAKMRAAFTEDDVARKAPATPESIRESLRAFLPDEEKASLDEKREKKHAKREPPTESFTFECVHCDHPNTKPGNMSGFEQMEYLQKPCERCMKPRGITNLST